MAMPRPASRHPTELELEILKHLWREGPLTGRQVRDLLAAQRELAYTSVMTVLGIMEQKGYVRRKLSDGSYLYSARVSEKSTTRRMLLDLVQRAYDGSIVSALVNLLETADVGDAELHELRELIKKKSLR
jgi:predicted transcriptional regulator